VATYKDSLVLLDDVNAAELIFRLPKFGQLAQALSRLGNFGRPSLELPSELK
jgi:hypothetical protein